MIELVQLEKHHEDFARRHVRVVVVSDDDPETAQKTQADFPHLSVVSDASHHLANAMQVIHPGAGREHKDTNAPTTFYIDGSGKVRWLFRPDYVIVRLPAADLLAAIDSH